MLDTAIIHGKLVGPDRVYDADIGIKDGKYAGFYAPGSAPEAKERIDARGNLVFPGIIDCHAHLNEPGFEYREDFLTGTSAAAVGGTTTVIDMPLNNEPPLVNRTAFDLKYSLIDAKAIIDYALWGGMVDYNLDDLPDLHECGVAAYKAFVCPMGTSTFTSVNMGQVKLALEKVKPFGLPSGFHCEEYGLVLELEARAAREGRNSVDDFLEAHSVFVEYLATRNIIDLCRHTGAKTYICHISHPSVAQLVKDAICEGLPIVGETCPHYLGFTADLVRERGAPAKCTPPMRDRDAVEGLWNYVLDGTLSCIGSDHSPAADEEKDNTSKTIWQAWGGLNAIQYFLPMMFDLVVHQRKLSPSLIARVMGTNPATVFGLDGRKGRFLVGLDGDIVIVDLDRDWVVSTDQLLTKGKVTAFENVRGKGAAVCSLVRGVVVAEEREIDGKTGVRRLPGSMQEVVMGTVVFGFI